MITNGMHIEELLHWTGAVVWLAAGSYVLVLVFHLGRGLFVAVDWMRWRLAVNRSSGLPLYWRALPRAFMRRWLEFSASASRKQFHSPYGRWDGFRQWTVYPRDDHKPAQKGRL